MMTRINFIGMGFLLFLIMVFSGCTAHVQPMISESEYLTSTSKMNGSAVLYVTDDFRSYTINKTDAMDLKKWSYELGPASVDAFKYALASRFEKVDVKLGNPDFTKEDNINKDLLVAVNPEFLSFDTHFPVAFKFETYRAVVSYKVKAYDKTGKLLLDEVYQGSGAQRGSIGYESAGHAANPVAAKMAIKDAVDKAVTAIMEAINSKQTQIKNTQ